MPKRADLRHRKGPPAGQIGKRKLQSALRQEYVRADAQRLRRRGQQFGDHEVPREQLDYERDVAHHLYVGGAQAAHQQIARQSAYADQRAEHGGQHDPQQSDAQRIGDTDGERTQVGVARRVGEERLTDVEPRGLAHKAEAGADLPGREVLGGVVPEKPAGGDQRA
jgi:hypothetical protein